MNDCPIKNGIKEYYLESWEEFHELVKKVFAVAPAYIYRGQTNYNWPLESTLDRLERRYPKRSNLTGGKRKSFNAAPSSDRQHLAAFKRAVRGRLGPNPQPFATADEWWALGQHHGLDTPLLDWTRSPYVALFFAFEEERCLTCESKWSEPENRGVYAVSTSTIEKAAEPEDDPVKIVSPASDSNYRLISQAAVLLRMPRKTNVESYVSRVFQCETHRSILTKVSIPNKERDDCLIALNKMNINHMTLFPDIDGAARHVNSLWQPGHEDLIAYV